MHFRHHYDAHTSTANRLVPGDRFHSEPLKGSRNVVLSDMVQREFVGEVAGNILRQPLWRIQRHVANSLGVGAELVAFNRNAPVSIHGGHLGRHIQTQELIAERGVVRVVRRGKGANRKDFVGACPTERKLGLKARVIHVTICVLLGGDTHVVRSHHAVNDEV